MTTKNTGGPAFPVSNDADKQYNWIEKGMSLRDYFAAKALQGMLSDPTRDGFKSDFAELAYGYADAMLKERETK